MKQQTDSVYCNQNPLKRGPLKQGFTVIRSKEKTLNFIYKPKLIFMKANTNIWDFLILNNCQCGPVTSKYSRCVMGMEEVQPLHLLASNESN